MYTHMGTDISERVGETVERPENLRHQWRDILVVLIPLALYVALAYPLRAWLIDDAGITFAYARNLALGHGLVSQPGAMPVEGYSNTLWLLLMVPFLKFGWFDLYLTPKLLGLGCMLITFYLIYRSVIRITIGSRIAAFLALVLIAANASFVIWTTSGLENPLFVLLIAALFLLTLRYIERNHTSVWYPLGAALIVFAAALTRPDGIAYAVIFPMVIVLRPFSMTGELVGRKLSHLLQYLLYLGLCAGGFLYFRQWYFSDWLPNTYYAKGGPEQRFLMPALTLQGDYLAKARELLSSLYGDLWWAVVVLLLFAGIAALLSRIVRVRPLLVAAAFVFVGYYVYLIMPNDWMGEFRFATPFFMLFHALVGSVLFLWMNNITGTRRMLNTLLIVLGGILLYGTAQEHRPRLEAVYTAPPVSFDRVAGEYAVRYDNYASALGIQNGSVLLPDVGATLWFSRLRVYDLGRLTDREIARTLHKDQKRFYDYVFTRIKPTFIHTHGSWTNRAAFEDDPRFRQQYVAIKEWPDKWVKEFNGRNLMSGDYVRRDAIVGREDLVRDLGTLDAVPPPPAAKPAPADTASFLGAHRLPQGFVELSGRALPNTRVDLAAAIAYRSPLDADSIELIEYGGSLHYQPVELAHRCYHFMGAYLINGDTALLRRTARYLRKTMELSRAVGDASYVPYSFDKRVHRDEPTVLKAPWYSGMAQGELLGASMRLWEFTGDTAFLNYGHRLFNSLLRVRGGDGPWVTQVDGSGYFWIEEYPHDETPDLTLNGYIAAVFGVYDYYRLTKSDSALGLYEACLTTLKHYLPQYRRPGDYSYYCLGHRSPANADYHNLHVSMCGHLHRMTGDEFFRTMAEELRSDTPPLRTDLEE